MNLINQIKYHNHYIIKQFQKYNIKSFPAEFGYLTNSQEGISGFKSCGFIGNEIFFQKGEKIFFKTQNGYDEWNGFSEVKQIVETDDGWIGILTPNSIEIIQNNSNRNFVNNFNNFNQMNSLMGSFERITKNGSYKCIATDGNFIFAGNHEGMFVLNKKSKEFYQLSSDETIGIQVDKERKRLLELKQYSLNIYSLFTEFEIVKENKGKTELKKWTNIKFIDSVINEVSEIQWDDRNPETISDKINQFRQNDSSRDNQNSFNTINDNSMIQIERKESKQIPTLSLIKKIKTKHLLLSVNVAEYPFAFGITSRNGKRRLYFDDKDFSHINLEHTVFNPIKSWNFGLFSIQYQKSNENDFIFVSKIIHQEENPNGIVMKDNLFLEQIYKLSIYEELIDVKYTINKSLIENDFVVTLLTNKGIRTLRWKQQSVFVPYEFRVYNNSKIISNAMEIQEFITKQMFELNKKRKEQIEYKDELENKSCIQSFVSTFCKPILLFIKYLDKIEEQEKEMYKFTDEEMVEFTSNFIQRIFNYILFCILPNFNVEIKELLLRNPIEYFNKLKIDIEIIRESLNLYENINYSQDFIYIFETSQIQQLKQDIDKLYEVTLLLNLYSRVFSQNMLMNNLLNITLLDVMTMNIAKEIIKENNLKIVKEMKNYSYLEPLSKCEYYFNLRECIYHEMNNNNCLELDDNSLLKWFDYDEEIVKLIIDWFVENDKNINYCGQVTNVGDKSDLEALNKIIKLRKVEKLKSLRKYCKKQVLLFYIDEKLKSVDVNNETENKVNTNNNNLNNVNEMNNNINNNINQLNNNELNVNTNNETKVDTSNSNNQNRSEKSEFEKRKEDIQNCTSLEVLNKIHADLIDLSFQFACATSDEMKQYHITSDELNTLLDEIFKKANELRMNQK